MYFCKSPTALHSYDNAVPRHAVRREVGADHCQQHRLHRLRVHKALRRNTLHESSEHEHSHLQ